MGEKQTKTGELEAGLDEANVADGWVSPDVLAARAGERVEFGKTVPTQEDLDNAEPTDA